PYHEAFPSSLYPAGTGKSIGLPRFAPRAAEGVAGEIPSVEEEFPASSVAEGESCIGGGCRRLATPCREAHPERKTSVKRKTIEIVARCSLAIRTKITGPLESW